MINAFTGVMWGVDDEHMQMLMREATGAELKPITAEMEQEMRREAFVTGRGLEHYAGAFAMARVGSTVLIPMIGMIRPRATFSWYYGYGPTTSLHTTSMDFAKAEADPTIDHIILAFDSGGGNTDAVDEFSAQVKDAKTKVTAYVEGHCASAAYWIASASDEVVVASTGVAGSIGVQGSVSFTTAEQMAKYGRETVTVTSKNASKKNLDITTDEGKAAFQAQVDDTEDVMIERIASNREITAAEVIEKYGQGALFVGKQATAAGLADRIGNLNELLGASLKKTSGGFGMTNEEKLAAHVGTLTAGSMYVLTMAGTFAPVPVTAEALAQVDAAGMAALTASIAEKAKAEGVAEGKLAAVTEEKERVAAIDAAFAENKLAKPVADAMKGTPGVTIADINAAVVAKMASGDLKATEDNGHELDAPFALDLEQNTEADAGGKVTAFPADLGAALKANAEHLGGTRGAK